MKQSRKSENYKRIKGKKIASFEWKASDWHDATRLAP